MICKMCATGADVISRVYELAEKNQGQGFELFKSDALEVGKEFHHHCSGKYACDCQHREQNGGQVQR